MKETLTGIAREAGAFLMRYFRQLSSAQIELKDNNNKNLVSFVDREAERIIFERLRTLFPDHSFLGEESGRTEGGKATFIVDPLDGTVNYTQGLPHFAVSIARHDGERVTHGLIYLPFFNELFWAESGKGAFLNDQPIRVSNRDKLEESVVATGFACIRGGMKPDGMTVFNRLIYQARDLRRLGAATVDLAYVACGIFDGFYEMGLQPWDVCAGALIVEEAGGMVSSFAGGTDPLFGDKILATNGRLHDKLKTVIEEALIS